jgi:hypothetical protein
MSSHATKFGVLISSNWDDLKDISRKSGVTGQKGGPNIAQNK